MNPRRTGMLIAACWVIGGLIALGLTIRVAREPGSSCGANGRTDCGTGFVVTNVVGAAVLMAGGFVIARLARRARAGRAAEGVALPRWKTWIGAAVMVAIGLGGLWYVERNYNDPNSRCGIQSTKVCSPARVGMVGGFSLMLLALAVVLVAMLAGGRPLAGSGGDGRPPSDPTS